MVEARQLLDEVVQRYQTLESYRDTGEVLDTMRADRPPRQQDHSTTYFATLFKRGCAFRFEFEQARGLRPTPNPHQRKIVWEINGEACAATAADDRVERGVSLSAELARMTGVSSTAAHTIPHLLLPDMVGGRGLSHASSVEAAHGSETDPAHWTTLRLHFAAPMASDEWALDATIDRNALAIVRIVNEHLFNTGPDRSELRNLRDGYAERFKAPWVSRSVTTYRPVLDADIDESEFPFIPPPEWQAYWPAADDAAGA